MRLRDLTTPQPINEVNMSPTGLAKLTSSINALAGMEFELIIPFKPINLREVPTSIDHICKTFAPYVSTIQGEELRLELEDSYADYLDDILLDSWESKETIALTRYFSSVEKLSGDALDDAVEDAIYNSTSQYYEVKHTWMKKTAAHNKLEESWLSESGFDSMRAVSLTHRLQLITGHGSALFDEKHRDSFSAAVGKPVRISSGYHRALRTVASYIMEPDISLKGSKGEPGIEFISPPQPITKMIEDLYKVSNWAKTTGAYTNESTGLHINVSVPNYSRENLDFIKLVLLIGDHYVLTAFDRMTNKYAESALNIIKNNIKTNPASASMLLDKMKSDLNASASKLVHSGITDKYTSVNVKDKWVEFRSPGNNWLADVDNGKIENTLLRFVVALDAAVDPEKFKVDYSKKLYKLLASSNPEMHNVIQLLANYAASGTTDPSAVRSILQQSAAARTANPTI